MDNVCKVRDSLNKQVNRVLIPSVFIMYNGRWVASSWVRVLHHLTSLGGLLETRVTIRRQIAVWQQDEIFHRKYMYNAINICLFNLYNCLCRSCFMMYLIPDQYFWFCVKFEDVKHNAYLLKPSPDTLSAITIRTLYRCLPFRQCPHLISDRDRIRNSVVGDVMLRPRQTWTDVSLPKVLESMLQRAWQVHSLLSAGRWPSQETMQKESGGMPQ